MMMMSENCIDKKENNKRSFNMRCLVDDREEKVPKKTFSQSLLHLSITCGL